MPADSDRKASVVESTTPTDTPPTSPCYEPRPHKKTAEYGEIEMVVATPKFSSPSSLVGERSAPCDCVKRAIYLMLSRHFDEDSPEQAEETAGILSAFVPSKTDDDDELEPRDYFDGFCRVVFGFGLEIPYGDVTKVDRFVDLIKALRDVPIEDGRTVTVNCDCGAPEISFIGFEEGFKTIHKRLSITGYEPTEAEIEIWKNSCNLLAHLTREELTSTSRVLEYLSVALEDNHSDTSERILACYVPVTKIWFEVAGRFLYAKCKDNFPSLFEGKGKLWTGEKGFSLERWAFWKEQLVKLSENELLSDENKFLTQATAELLNVISGPN